MAAQRSDEIMLDDEAVSRALKAPRAPQFSSGVRPKYRLEDRLSGAGTLGSIVPPSERELEAMRPTYAPAPGSSRATMLAIVLVVLAAVTGGVVYRDVHREPPPASVTESE